MEPAKLDWLKYRQKVELKPVYDPEKEERVNELLERLSDTQRDVVLMKAGAGLKHKVIGAYLWPELEERLATKRSESHYAAALKKLRDMDWAPKPDPVLALFSEKLKWSIEDSIGIFHSIIVNRKKSPIGDEREESE